MLAGRCVLSRRFPDTGRAEKALDALLRAAIDSDEKRPAKGKLAATPFKAPDRIPTRTEAQVSALLADPVGAALRLGIWRLGVHLFDAIGSTDGMHEVLDRVAEMDPARGGQRATIIDHAWNGIGAGADRWHS